METSGNMDINIKFLEILSNIVLEQNKQLLQIIADEEGIGYKRIANFLPSRYELKKQLQQLGIVHDNQRNRCEKSNSSSESSESLASELDVE